MLLLRDLLLKAITDYGAITLAPAEQDSLQNRGMPAIIAPALRSCAHFLSCPTYYRGTNQEAL